MPLLGALTPERRCLPSTYILALCTVYICIHYMKGTNRNERITRDDQETNMH